MKAYVHETVENSQKLVLSKIESSGEATRMRVDHFHSETQARINNLDSKLDRYIKAVERKQWWF